jgi:septum formation protein
MSRRGLLRWTDLAVAWKAKAGLTMGGKPVLHLASASPRRREILTRLRIPFRIVKSSYEENNRFTKHPRKLVLHHARQKALHAKAPANGLILAADTIVVCRGKILGKPQNLKRATAMLQMLSGRMHSVYTGVALLDKKSGKAKAVCVRTRVYMKKLDAKQIENYFRKMNPLDKAGAYAIQMNPKIVKRIDGSYSNVVGLPVEMLKEMLKRFG